MHLTTRHELKKCMPCNIWKIYTGKKKKKNFYQEQPNTGNWDSILNKTDESSKKTAKRT